MSETRSCPRCGATLADDAPDAPCAACLMQIGMENWTREEAGPNSPGQKSPIAQTELQSPQFDAPELDRVGELFPELEIKRLLGVGGMGAVYLARQKSLPHRTR